jgi:hypothetical protein
MARPSKIDPNWDFWFVNMPSGNPVAEPPRRGRGDRGPMLCLFNIFAKKFGEKIGVFDLK